MTVCEASLSIKHPIVKWDKESLLVIVDVKNLTMQPPTSRCSETFQHRKQANFIFTGTHIITHADDWKWNDNDEPKNEECAVTCQLCIAFVLKIYSFTFCFETDLISY